MLAQQMVEAPNKPFGNLPAHMPEAGKCLFGASQTLRLTVGPPTASMAVWILEPKTAPKATVLVVHGTDAEKMWMLDIATSLQDQGFRVVLMDLRGNGDSTGEYLTFGVQESKDLSQLITALQSQNLIAGKIGVYGISYGAAVAIELAGQDPRIAAVVAVAPFSSMREEVPVYARRMMPLPGAFLSQAELQSIITQAGTLAHFDPDAASPLLAAQQTTAPILILHGDADYVIPIEQSQSIAAASPTNVTLHPLPGYGHVKAWADPDGIVARQTADWFEKELSGAK